MAFSSRLPVRGAPSPARASFLPLPFRRPTRKRFLSAFTLVEAVLASVLALLLFSLLWAILRRATDSQGRMLEVMKTMDVVTLQATLDEDIRTAIEVIEPGNLESGPRLVFKNRQYEDVTYETEGAGQGGTGRLWRTARSGSGANRRIVARSIESGIFYRMGPRLVGYVLTFASPAAPGARQKSRKEKKLVVESRVFLSNGLY